MNLQTLHHLGGYTMVPKTFSDDRRPYCYLISICVRFALWKEIDLIGVSEPLNKCILVLSEHDDVFKVMDRHQPGQVAYQFLPEGLFSGTAGPGIIYEGLCSSFGIPRVRWVVLIDTVDDMSILNHHNTFGVVTHYHTEKIHLRPCGLPFTQTIHECGDDAETVRGSQVDGVERAVHRYAWKMFYRGQAVTI